MKIAVIIPDRRDRPKFLANCFRMIRNQSILPDHVEVVNYYPISDECDITPRYKLGYDNLRGKGFDCILFIENDDWYSPYYIETMITEWIKAGKPEIFGTNYTIYYHIKLFAWFTMEHYDRSSAMSTLIKPDLEIKWPVDNDPYTDIALWQQLKGVTFKPTEYICLGIKHGVGKTGGVNHTDKLGRYINFDSRKQFLSGIMDIESFKFYSQYFNEGR